MKEEFFAVVKDVKVMQQILELACITVYGGVHSDLQQLDSFDAKLTLIKHKLDSFEANLNSQKRKLDSFDANLNSLKRKPGVFLCKLEFS